MVILERTQNKVKYRIVQTGNEFQLEQRVHDEWWNRWSVGTIRQSPPKTLVNALTLLDCL